jgi:NADH dehydrogenase (ubiquinone) Fe-S protein 5
MSSGFGFQGGEGRCSKLWLSYSDCVQGNKDKESLMTTCIPLRNDYFECLHHKKEFERRNIVAKQLQAIGGKIPDGSTAAGTDGEANNHSSSGGH